MIDLNVEDNELDFLNDDSESENEGRFKSKPSASNKPAAQPSKPSYSSKYDKGKSSYRSDYKRDDRYSSKRKDYGNRKNTPELESRKKSPTDRKPKISSKDKEDSKSNIESERKPMFKSTFKSIDSGEKKSGMFTFILIDFSRFLLIFEKKILNIFWPLKNYKKNFQKNKNIFKLWLNFHFPTSKNYLENKIKLKPEISMLKYDWEIEEI